MPHPRVPSLPNSGPRLVNEQHRVSWLPDAEDDLITIWTDAADRQSVTDAERRISMRLQVNPANQGTPVAEGLRKLLDPPLLVYFFRG
jgi:plasmid stabilization system protein ParE